MGTCRYISEFFGQNSGIRYRFELHDLDYSGSSVEVTLDAGGVQIEYASDENIFSGIRASSCTAVMKLDNVTIENQILSLLEKADKKLYILIYKDSNIYWGGPVNTKGIEIEQNSNPPFIKWQAMDWIGGLQNIKWDNTNWGIITNGINSYAKVLADMLIKAYPSFANTFYMPGTTLFSTVSPVTSTQFTGNPDPFAKTGFYASAYTDDKYNYSFTYHQVLEMLLTDWCAKIIYSDGIYRVIDLRMYNWPTQWKEYLYDKNGTEISNSTYDNTVNYDGDDYVWAVDPLLKTDVPIKKVLRTFRTELSLRLNDQEGYLTTLTSPRSFIDTYNIYGRVLTGWLDYLKTGINMGDGDLIQITVRLNIKDVTLTKCLKNFYLVIEVTDGVTTKRLANNTIYANGVTPQGNPADNIWVTANSAYFIKVPYPGGNQNVFTFKFKAPYPTFSFTNIEYAFTGSYYRKTGLITNGSNVIRNIDASDLQVGMGVDNTYGIASGTTITAINSQTNSTGQTIYTVTLSANATYTGNVGISFYNGAEYIYLGDEVKAEGSIEVTYLPNGAVNTNEGAQYSATNSNQANINIELPDARVGDELNNAGKTALQIYNGTFWAPSTGLWKYRAALTTEATATLHQKLVNNISEFRIKPLKLYSGTLFYRQFYNPHAALIFTINGTSYTLVFNGGSINLDNDSIEGEWWMIQRTTGSTTGNSGNTGTKIGTKDIYKDVYPYTDVPKLDNDIKISQYEIGSGTQALSMMRSAIEQTSNISLGYVASDPQFAFQETGATPTATNVKEGDICFTNSNGKQWKYTNGAWVQQFQAQAAGSGGVSTIGTIDSQTKSANGLVISGTSLVAQTADASNVGMVSIGTQTFAGAKTFSAALSALRSLITGTGGNGYVEIPAQSSAPSTPASGLRLFADSLSRLVWKGTNGFIRILDGASNTADRTYTLPDKSGTIQLMDDRKVYSIAQNSAAVTLGNTTSLTLLASITIPAGTLAVGDSVKVLMMATCNNNANNKIMSCTINATTASTFGQMTMTTHTGGIMEFSLKVTSLTNIRTLNLTNNNSYTLTNLASPRNYTVSDVSANSFTIDIYGQKLTSGADTLILEHYAIIIQKI